MRQFIRRAAIRCGYDIIKHVVTPVSPFPVLDFVIDAQVAAGARPFVVQIGANDGMRADPVQHLIKKHKLPALLVEPLPDVNAQLQKNYEGTPNIRFEQCAIGEQDGEVTIYRVRPEPGLPDWLQGIASLDREHLTTKKFEFDDIDKYVEAVRVPMLAVPNLLKKHGIRDVGLLQVDTEGFDCRIVMAALRGGVRPAVINYERHHAHAIEQAACKRVLDECGYDFVDVGIDTIAVRR